MTSTFTPANGVGHAGKAAGTSGLIAIEAQLISVAQRHLQVRFGPVFSRRGDGWVLFSFDALTNSEEADQLGKEVQRLCNALVRDVTNNRGQLRIRLAGEGEEANFSAISEGAVGVAELMRQSGDMAAAADLAALGEGGKGTGDKALRTMLETLYTDVVGDCAEGVHGVTSFPRAMCPAGKRFDVVMKQSVCIKAYSQCTLEDSEVIGRGAAAAANAANGADILAMSGLRQNGSSGADDKAAAALGPADDPDTPSRRPNNSSLMEGSFLQNSMSMLVPPKGKAMAKLFLDSATVAHALSFYSSITIEKELPAAWRAKAFSLSEAGEVLRQVHASLRRHWAAQMHAHRSGGGNGTTERMKINAISLLAIVSGDLREYLKNQIMLVGAAWRGPWRMPGEDLRAALDLFKQWHRITAVLTKGGEWAGWDGGSFHDESFDRLAGRLRDAVRVRETIAEMQNLSTDGRIPDALSPEIVFDRCSVFDDAAREEWARCVATFDKEMSFLEPQLRTRVKAALSSVPAGDSQLRLAIANRTLLRRTGIRTAVEKELDIIAEHLTQQLDQVRARHENAHRRAGTSLQKLRITRGCQAECAFIPALANRVFGASPQLDAVTAHAQAVLTKLSQEEDAVAEEWVKTAESTAKSITALEDAVVVQRLPPVQTSTTEDDGFGLLSCVVHSSIRQFVMDVHNVRAWAFAAANVNRPSGSDKDGSKEQSSPSPASSTAHYALSESAENAIKACENLLAAATRTQQSVANFNTVLHQTIPCTRPMLLPAITRATQQILYADSHKRAISLANHHELEGLNLRFQNVVETLSSENRHIRRFHCEFISQVLALHNLDLTRHMDQWRSAVDGMRSAFDEFLSQRRLESHGEWRRHWDCQIYKALEYQYRKGLESLHENMEELRVELVFKQSVVQFKPSFEAIREAYYIKLREFVSVPLRFRGLQPKRADSSESYEIYPEMPARNHDRIVTVHTRAVELFQKLNRVRKAFRTHVSVGLCGANGAPDMDAIVAKWATESAAAAAKTSAKTAKKGAAPRETNYFAEGLAVVKDHVLKLAKIDDVMKLDCFAISTVPVKATIEEQLRRLEESLLNCMRQSIQTALNEIDTFVFTASNVVERQPTTMDEVGLANKAHRECAAQLKSYEQRLREVERQNKELRAQSGASIELGATKTRWDHLKEAMASHAKVMEASVAKMRVSLDGLIQKFLKDVQRFSHKWKRQKAPLMQAFLDKKTDVIQRMLDGLKDQVNDLEDLKTQAKELEAKCDYFNQPKPSFSLLTETVQDVVQTSNMWALYDKFQAQLATLRGEDWLTFRSHAYQFEDFCKEWTETLDRRTLEEEDSAAKSKDGKKKADGSHSASAPGGDVNAIAVYLKKLLKDWSVVVPLLKVVRGDGWMTEHWNELFRLLEIPKGMTSTDLTFGNILDAYPRLIAKEPELKQLQARALGEIQIREALQDLRTWALEATFTLVSPSALTGGESNSNSNSNSGGGGANAGPRVKLITEWKEVMADVSDNQALLSSLKDSPFYVNFADEAAGWEVKLAALAESLVLLNSIQRKWAYLEPIFSRGALPQEQARFRRVDKEFTGILHEVEADPRVMSLASSVDLNDKLKGILEQIERCQKSLMEYLEAKRDKLPRFYFISDEDLLEILGHSQNPSVIQAHLKKLFMGIHSVVFNKEETAITHMVSADRERVPLLREVSITDKDVEDWLIRLDEAMRATLQEMLVKCAREEDDPTSPSCIRGYPSQILQVALQVRFAADVESAIATNSLKEVLAQERRRLETLTRADTATAPSADEDANVTLLKVKALILDVIHNIEVVDLLLVHQVRRVEEWHWQKQLRYSMDAATGLCRVHMTDTSFAYTYEYQGNAAKLVHTPLTDKCYLVLTKGMDLGYGGNPYGPAGTGKTESVKALGSAMGRQVLVFNCDEGIDFQAMGRIFVGIVKCGAWGCFDEFNRLKIDQLSAISQMIQVIQEALKNKEPSCPLLSKDVDVNHNAGIFVTLNPAGKGYGGRTKLPDNLKQLFREVAMSVPDNALITATMLLSEGFTHARALAKNVVELYRLCGQLMSHQQHYDWGLRPLKAVLRLGGTLIQRWRREHEGKSPSEVEETELMIQSLNINTLSKLTFDDARLFVGLLRDIFPGAQSREVTYAELEEAVKTAVRALHLQPVASQTSKVLQLYESMNQRMGVVLVGPSGSGKSTLIRILKKALEVMGTAVPLHVMNPKAMPRRQLLGYMDPDTREWYDGVLTAAAREAVKQPKESRPWIICDGDIDPEWIESLNSVLDDNKLLTMPNGVRIQFGSNVNFLFETHSLQFASPATVSRMGVIFFSERDVNLEAVVESLLIKHQAESRRGSFSSGSGTFAAATPSAAATLESSWKDLSRPLSEKERKQLMQWIMKYTFAAIDEATRMEGALSVPTTRMGLLKACLNHITDAQSEADFIFALVRGLGSTLVPAAHEKLAKWLYEASGQKPLSESRPLNTYWDTARKRPAEFAADLSASVTPSNLLAGHAPVIRTVEIQRLEATLSPLIRDAGCKPVFLVGPEGVGKAAAIKHCLARKGGGGGAGAAPTAGIRTAVINCSAQTNSVQLIQKLEQLCVPYNTTTGRALRPKEGDRLVLILKNVNLSKPDKYGTVELHSFLQQLILYHGFYNSELEWITVDRVQLVATMNPNASAGRYVVAPRLLAVVNVITVGSPSKQSLLQIYGTYWAALLKSTSIGQGRDFDNGTELSQFVINVYEKMRRRFEGEEYAHFFFCPRHITSWIANVLLYKIDAQTTLPAVLAYEAQRIFADCLPTPEDRGKAEKIFAEQLATIGYSAPAKDDRYSTMFVTWFSGVGTVERTDADAEANADRVESTASTALASRKLLEQRKYKDVVQEVESALLRYSREFKTLSIPMLPPVLSWVTCVDRVLSKAAGHLIVVGRPGVGRRDSVVLAAYMQRMELVSLNMSQDYGLKNFKNDLRGIIQRAVQRDSRLVLVLEEHNLVHESFLELINSLVSGGEAPGLFTAEEMEMMYSPLREEAANEGFIGPIQTFYLERLQRNLHIALVMDNRHPLFLVRLQSNPGLLSRCELLWMGAWSNEVTKTMCKTFLKEKIEALEANKAYRGFHLHREMLAIHESVPDATPKDFEVFMKTYKGVVDAKSKASGEDLERLETGLAKLKEAEEKVENIKRDVGKKKDDVEAMQREADRALNEIQKNMQASQEQRDAATELQEQLKEEHEDILVKRQKSEEELSSIKPLLEAARDAVSGIRSEQLNEIRSLKAPPEPIRDVLEGVLALLGVKDVSWNSMRSFLGERGAKERILDFDVHSVTPAIRNGVAKLLSQKAQSFKPEVIRRASVVAAPMAEWVKAMIEYATITERIAPLTRQLDQLEQNQREGEEKLDALKKKLKKIDKLVEGLREEFSSKCKEAEKLRGKLEKAEQDLTKAQELLEKLSGEKTRWARDAAAIRQSNQLMPLRALVSSAFITYLPKSTEDVRQRYRDQWMGRLAPFIAAIGEKSTTADGKPDAASMRLVGFLRSEAELLQYKAEGLPADELSQENAMVMLDTIQIPLVIDPANQAVDWMKTHLKNQNTVVEVTSLHDERFTHSLELAIRFGKTLLVTEVGNIDPILFPVLRKDLISAGAKRVVQVGAKTVDWQETFRIMLFTRSTDLVLPPGAASLVTEVNFSVTSRGLESQLLGITIQHEKPELEAQKVELLKKEERLKLELTKLEAQLLKDLAESHGNLMENTELVSSLNTVKTQAATIHEALAKSHALQAELDEKRDVYRLFASTSAKLFFLVKDLERLNRMYQFGLTDFIGMFCATLAHHGSGGSEAGARKGGVAVEGGAEGLSLTQRFAQVVFQRVSMGLLKRNRIVFGLHLLHGYLPADTFPPDQWDAFIGTVKDVQEDAALPTWAPVESRVKYASLISCAAGPSLVERWGLANGAAAGGVPWSAWVAAPHPEEALAHLPLMEQLLLVHTFRPDRLSILCSGAILSHLKVDALAPNVSLEENIVGAAATTPILFITTSGADPSMEVQDVAMLRVGKQRFTQIALGGGQTDEAMQQVRRCAVQGDWIFLKNLHLVLDWAAALEKELCSMPAPNPDFRLIITTEPHESFPSVLLRMSLKVTVEAPPGVKQNLLRTYTTWDRVFLEAQTDSGAPMLFALAWLHAIAQERRSFVPQGWVKFYEFSPADLKAATAIIVAQSRRRAHQGLASSKQPLVDWVTIKGFLEHCIYGGRLDNPHDEETLSLLIHSYFSEDCVLRAKVPLSRDVTVPATNNHDAVVAMLHKVLPDVDPPSLLKLPDNADRAVQEGIAATQVEMLRAISQQAPASHIRSAEGWRKLLTPVLELWKNAGLAGAVGPLRSIAQGNADPDPMEVFFVSEVNMLTRLIADLAVYFDSLRALADGALIPSDALRDEASELATGRMPANWLDRMNGPKEAKLWLALLSRKHASTTAMLKNTANATSTVYDLTDLLRPETFLNALRQHTARQCKTPLVDLVLVATVGAHAIPTSLKVVVNVKASSICLQGAAMEADGQLIPLPANAPSSTPLTTNITVRWIPETTLAERMQQSRGKLATIPVYASADRAVLLFPLTVPCGGPEDAMALNLNGVACYLMTS